MAHNSPHHIPYLLLAAILLAGCGNAVPLPPSTHTPIPLVIPQGDYPLSNPGPYQITYLLAIKYTDPSRGNREVSLNITYPVKSEAPDRSAAPYPVIIASTKTINIFGDNLASWGFVAIGVNYLNTYYPWDENLVDQPLDILFALDQVSKNPPKLLKGMMDTDHAGTLGYSFDGTNSLTMSGARVDPQWLLDRCANPPVLDPHVTEFGVENYCTIAEDWDAFLAHAGDKLTTSTDGLWQPIADPRIQAVMPMAPDGTWLFGDRGLAAADRPMLIIDGTEDQYCPYLTESAYMYDHAGSAEKYLITFVGQEHMMIFDTEQLVKMKHFSVAFFGYYLQGRQDFAYYFSQEFVSKSEGLYWGIYTEQ